MTPSSRFWPKVNASGKCWLWTASKVPNGYGKFWSDGRLVYAHRWAYEMWFGPIPEGLQIDHLCRNRACVRPTHLEAVTHQENLRRGKALVTHCPQGHAYEGDNVRLSEHGHRLCRECRNAQSRACYARAKANG